MGKLTLTVLTLVLAAWLAGISGCQSSSTSLGEPIKDGHPKLDSALNRLVQAEERGEAATFARQGNIGLVDGKVRVIVECLPDKIGAVASAAGAVAVVESRYDNLLQVLVSIAKLRTLAELEGVRFVRLPQTEMPGGK